MVGWGVLLFGYIGVRSADLAVIDHVAECMSIYGACRLHTSTVWLSGTGPTSCTIVEAALGASAVHAIAVRLLKITSTVP